MKNNFFSRLLTTCAVAAIFLSLAGCYTLLKHPRFSDEERSAYEENATAVTYADDCGSCHESPSYTAVHGYSYGSPHRSSYDRWYYYYEYPWWVRYYSDPGDGSGEAGEQQQRPFGRRRRGSNDSEPSQSAVSGSDQTAAPSPAVVSKPSSDAGKSEPAQKEERRDDRRSGSEDKQDRRERKP